MLLCDTRLVLAAARGHLRGMSAGSGVTPKGPTCLSYRGCTRIVLTGSRYGRLHRTERLFWMRRIEGRGTPGVYEMVGAGAVVVQQCPSGEAPTVSSGYSMKKST